MASKIKDIIRDELEDVRKEDLTLESDSKEILEKICHELEVYFTNQLD